MKVRFNLSIRLILIILFVLFMFSLRVIGDEGQVKIRWKNGDVLPGRVLQSQNPVLHFSSEIFQDNLAISTSELEALEFDSEKENSDLNFLIVTTTGDVIKANLIDANENSFIFSSKRLSRIQIKRDSVYSLNRLNNPNLIFDGSQLNEWNLYDKKSTAGVDITLPGDEVIPTSDKSPGKEQAFNAIDNNPSTKYLNFDKSGTGLTITTTGGVVNGMALTSGNDSPDRDPANFILSGSNDDGATFTEIASGEILEFSKRFERRTLNFNNDVAYTTFKLIFPTTMGPSGCCMQIAEIELLSNSKEAENKEPHKNPVSKNGLT